MLNYSNNIQDVTDKDKSPKGKLMSLLAKVSFTIFLFFIFFGTQMPFGEKIWEAESMATSNVTNQIVFGGLFVCSIILLIPKKRELFSLIKREKFLTIFLIWCIVTIIWSKYPFVSFKRYVQYLVVITVCLSVFLHVKDYKQIIKIFKIILAVYLIVSLGTILTIPGAKDRFGIWRGVAPHKNILGQISLISVIFFTVIIKKDYSLKSRAGNALFIVIALVLMIGSKSSTSLFTFIIIFLFSLTVLVDKIFEPIGIRKTVSLLTVFAFVVMFVLIILVVPELLESIAGGVGKDLTLTGRVDLWADIWEEAQHHLFIGAGFQGYWVVTSSEILQLYEIYHWLPIQAHNGYLDIINELGIIGTALFLLILINYFVNLALTKQKQIWKWFIIAALIINFTESAFIRPKAVIGVMFMFSYVALFSDLIKDKQPDSVTE